MVCWSSFPDGLLIILSVWGFVLVTHENIICDLGFVLNSWVKTFEVDVIFEAYNCFLKLWTSDLLTMEYLCSVAVCSSPFSSSRLGCLAIWGGWALLCCLSNANRMVVCQQLGRMWIWAVVWFWVEMLKAVAKWLVVTRFCCRWHLREYDWFLVGRTNPSRNPAPNSFMKFLYSTDGGVPHKSAYGAAKIAIQLNHAWREARSWRDLIQCFFNLLKVSVIDGVSWWNWFDGRSGNVSSLRTSGN